MPANGARSIVRGSPVPEEVVERLILTREADLGHVAGQVDDEHCALDVGRDRGDSETVARA